MVVVAIRFMYYVHKNTQAGVVSCKDVLFRVFSKAPLPEAMQVVLLQLDDEQRLL